MSMFTAQIVDTPAGHTIRCNACPFTITTLRARGRDAAERARRDHLLSHLAARPTGAVVLSTVASTASSLFIPAGRVDGAVDGTVEVDTPDHAVQDSNPYLEPCLDGPALERSVAARRSARPSAETGRADLRGTTEQMEGPYSARFPVQSGRHPGERPHGRPHSPLSGPRSSRPG